MGSYLPDASLAEAKGREEFAQSFCDALSGSRASGTSSTATVETAAAPSPYEAEEIAEISSRLARGRRCAGEALCEFRPGSVRDGLALTEKRGPAPPSPPPFPTQVATESWFERCGGTAMPPPLPGTGRASTQARPLPYPPGVRAHGW